MFAYLLRRIAVIIPTLIFVSILIFGLQQLLPGDPALALAGEDRDPKVIAFLRAKYHLDQPLPVRYGLWVGGLLHGDLGESIRINRPVLELIVEKLPVTAELAGLAMCFALLIGIPAGIVSAVKNGTVWDYGANVFALWGLSTPNFWLGFLMILLFSVELGWLPASGFVSPREDLRQNLGSMVMPAFVLGNAIAAIMMRHTRSAMLQVMGTDYIRTARAKGLNERVVILKHGLQRAGSRRDARRARVRPAALRRRPDRAGLHHSRLRQAHRRRGVQSRLRRGAGRRPVHRDRLYLPQPARRSRLFPRQPAPACVRPS